MLWRVLENSRQEVSEEQTSSAFIGEAGKYKRPLRTGPT